MRHIITLAPDIKINLRDYGILVPLLDSRVDQIVNELTLDQEIFGSYQEAVKLIQPDPVSWHNIALVHHMNYVSMLKNNPHQAVVKAYGLLDQKGEPNRYDPSTAQIELSHLVEQARLACGGVYESAKVALQHQFCFYLNSYAGAHHAHTSYGNGFCLMNDIVIVARMMQEKFSLKNIWIIDVDAHKGDGTSEITMDDPTIKTLSIHMKYGWPLDVADSDFSIGSDIDVAIDEGEEGLYLDALEKGLSKLETFELADFAIVVNGSDPFVDDQLPSATLLKLSLDQLLQRDLLVYEFLKKLQLPQLWLMSGGYGDQVYKVYLQFLKHLLRLDK